MALLIWRDIRHHAHLWLWSLLVCGTGALFIGAIILTWWSAHRWALLQPDPGLPLVAGIIGANLVTYGGLATAAVLATTAGLTVAAQRRSHALWRILGIPGPRIRTVVLTQVGLVAIAGGAIGAALAVPAVGTHLLSWRDVPLFPVDLPVVVPWFAWPTTVLLTLAFALLGALGAARRAATVPEMRALRDAAAPEVTTRWWQWLLAALLGFGAVSRFRDGDGGAAGQLVTVATLLIPQWTLRPLLWWTRLWPGGNAWFAACAAVRHRAALSLTTIAPFAIAVGMTGTSYAIAGARRAADLPDGGAGFLTVAVPVLTIAGVGAVAAIAMLGRDRRREAALLEVIGARRGVVVASTILEGVILAVTGIIHGLAMTALTASLVPLASGGGWPIVLPTVELVPVAAATLLLAVAATWLPLHMRRRPLRDALRQPA